MRLLTAIFTGLFGSSCDAKDTRVGQPAPQVSGINQEGKTVDFNDLYQKGPTVVFFYPKASTPGCTAQACSLRDAFADLTKEGVQVIGVSLDTVEAQKKFKTDRKLPYDLIADTEGKVLEAFKVGKVMGGLLSMAQRQCFLIKDSKIVWHDESASTSSQANDIKKALASLE
ncbi:peroxiredoxin [Prosthecobacter fusiformis]|nr:peroxiredoxin [Prosthecobacter fusiformis]